MARLAFVIALSALAASCASAPVPPLANPIRIAIAGIESKESLGGPALAESVNEHLQDELFACRRFEILERKRLGRVIEEEGELSAVKAGADLIVYGVITQENGGAYVHLRVVRVTTCALAYSGCRLIKMTEATSSKLAARSAVEELVREINIRIP